MKAKITILDAAATTGRRAKTLESDGSVLRLTRTCGVNVKGALGWTVRVLHGAVWITRDGDIRDIVLEAREEHVLDSDGDVMLWTLNDEDAALVINLREEATPRPSAVSAARPALA